MPQKSKRVQRIPLEQRDKSTIRAVVLARMSDPNAKDISMETQVEACEKFIEKMGWPKPTLGPFTDKASGYLQVERPALDEVQRLISKRLVDVVVVLNWDRLARDVERRYAATYQAKVYGVEYRFTNLEPDGKMPDTTESQIYMSVMQVVGMISRNTIVENTQRGKAKRVQQGYPSGGRGGAPYGLRLAVEGDTTKYWAERKDEADNLRYMFTWLVEMAETKDPRASARGVVRELTRKGIRTRAGKDWSCQTVIEKMRNPLYCGKGLLNRWQTVREDRTNEETGETYNDPVVRARDPKETSPIGKDMVPTLVDPELFDKVQAILLDHNTSAGRLGREGSARAVDATLLHSGFLRCALCGHSMVRYWRAPSPRHPDGVVYYRCSTDANFPERCTRHSIRAAVVEDFALRGLATVLSDPEKIVALADAAGEKLEEANYAFVKTTIDIEAMDALVAQIEVEITDTLAAIDALSKLPGMESTVANLRTKVIDLNVSLNRAQAERIRLNPKRVHAEERQAFLRSLLSQRDKLWMPFEHAGKLLGDKPSAPLDDDDDLVWDLNEPSWLNDPAIDTWPDVPYRSNFTGVEVEDDDTYQAKTDYVVYSLLRRTEHGQLRKLLRELDVVVRVKPPRSPEERATRGTTPPEERITVAVGKLVIQGAALVYAAQESGSLDVRKVTKSETPTISTPAAHRSG